MNRKNVWVTGNRTDGYRVVSEGASRAMSKHDVQADAIAAGRETAKARGGELTIQGTDGKIRARDSHDHDPRSSKG